MKPKIKLDSSHPEEVRQHITLIFLAPFGAAIFAMVGIYDFFYLQQTHAGLFAAILSLAFLATYLHYRFTNNRKLGITIIGVVSTVVMFAFILLNQNQSFGLVWALLYPPLMIMIFGHQTGVKLSVAAYVVFVAVLFSGIGVWNGGLWDMTSLIRFSLGFIALTYLSYVLALGNDFSYDILVKKHDSEISKQKQMERLALTDSLTGTLNRFSLNKDFQAYPNHEVTSKENNMVFFIAQIDFFKNYVDEYGFKAGDDLLVHISQIIQNQMKPVNGKLYRITGSQFAGTVITKDITKALILIKEIQELVLNQAIAHENTPQKKVHISIGITIDNHFETLSLTRLMKKADEALYKSFEKQSKEAVVLDTRKDSLLKSA